MNPEPENFDRLKKLLALKRYEQPPPGYFNGFSRQVTTRIRAGQRGGAERMLGEAVWLVRVWEVFQNKPVLAGGFGAAICALVIFGIISADRISPAPGANELLAGQSAGVSTPAPVALNPQMTALPVLSSTNPVTPGPLPSTLNSLFDQLPLRSQPAAAGFGGN